MFHVSFSQLEQADGTDEIDEYLRYSLVLEVSGITEDRPAVSIGSLITVLERDDDPDRLPDIHIGCIIKINQSVHYINTF